MDNVYGLAYQNQNQPILNRFIASVRSAGYSSTNGSSLRPITGLSSRLRVNALEMPVDTGDSRVWWVCRDGLKSACPAPFV